MQELSQATKKLISQYKIVRHQNIVREGVATIHVDEFASNVAAFYEKIRMIVDWKEEHLIRRTAIIRKLKRRFVSADIKNISSGETIAESLVLELIRTGHFPNDRIEEAKIDDVKNVLDKYIFILKNSPSAGSPRKAMQLYNWIVEVSACEIEETLAPSRKESALIEFMFEIMKKNIILSDKFSKKNIITEDEKNIQIYVAVQQALFKLDNPLISYNLLKYIYPGWRKSDITLLSSISQNIYKIWDDIDVILSHPLGKKFYTICEKYDTPYLLLGDVLSTEEDLEKIESPEYLESAIKKAYAKRLGTLKQRLSRAAFLSTLSAMLTNAFSVFFVEVPLALWIYGGFSTSPFLTISVDIMGPTLLIFLMVISIRMPSKDNLGAVVLETMKIVYQREKNDTYQIRPTKKGGVITATIITLLYLITAALSFGAIIWIFHKAKFPITSSAINIVLIAIIFFAGLAVRRKGEELTVQERKPGFLGFIFDIISLPLAGTGRWLSNKWKKYNAIAAFFNALIDTPFAIFVEFIEKWRYFIKERKEEIR